MKILAWFLLGIAVAGGGVPLGQKLIVQSTSTPQGTALTRIYIPWFSGTDAGYTSLLQVNNISVDPYTLTTGTTATCYVDSYFNCAHNSGSLGTIPAGQVTVFTLSQIETASGLDLANSGQRAILYLSCSTKYIHAQTLLVNPGGVVTFIPGYIIPPNRTLATGPEQLLQ